MIGFSLRPCDQLKPDVVWDVFGKVIQSNARLGLTDRLEVHLDHVRMPADNGKEKTKRRSLYVLSVIKKCIVLVKAAFLHVAHALIIVMARVNGDPKYQSYRYEYLLDVPADELLMVEGVDSSNGGGFEDLQQFHDYISDYKIIVYDVLSPTRFIFTGNSFG